MNARDLAVLREQYEAEERADAENDCYNREHDFTDPQWSEWRRVGDGPDATMNRSAVCRRCGCTSIMEVLPERELRMRQ